MRPIGFYERILLVGEFPTFKRLQVFDLCECPCLSSSKLCVYVWWKTTDEYYKKKMSNLREIMMEHLFVSVILDISMCLCNYVMQKQDEFHLYD